MDLDVTVIVQAVIVVCVLALVGPLLFKPILEVLELREKSITGAREEGALLLSETKHKEDELHAKLEDARRRAMADRAKLVADARAAEREVLEKAKADAQQKIDAARSQLAQSAAKTQATLKSSAGSLASAIATKILSREVRS